MQPWGLAFDAGAQSLRTVPVTGFSRLSCGVPCASLEGGRNSSVCSRRAAESQRKATYHRSLHPNGPAANAASCGGNAELRSGRDTATGTEKEKRQKNVT